MIDIHCHILPGLDDGATSWEESLAMARIAAADGVETVIATPHQLGNYGHNHSSSIRELVGQLQQRLDGASIPLTVLPGADVRVEPDLVERLAADQVLTLGDRRRHVLLELPHELYLPLEPVLIQLKSRGISGILSHPERNLGLLADGSIVEKLVDAGCLMQVTSGSLLGTFGSACQRMAESMLKKGLVHFLASDGHSSRQRRPRMLAACQRAAQLTDQATSLELCHQNPKRVCRGEAVASGRIRMAPRRTWLSIGRHS
jgi:protein-tyrosine phosphatase